MSPNAAVSHKPKEIGRRSKFDHNEDFMIVQEFLASEGNIDPQGETGARYQTAADHSMGNPNLDTQVKRICV